MRTLLISGASRGIGLNIAYKELKAGNRISLGLTDEDAVKGTLIAPKIRPKEKILINKYDALDKFSAKEWVENTISNFGGFDTLINCSGCLLYTSPSPRDGLLSRMPSSA